MASFAAPQKNNEHVWLCLSLTCFQITSSCFTGNRSNKVSLSNAIIELLPLVRRGVAVCHFVFVLRSSVFRAPVFSFLSLLTFATLTLRDINHFSPCQQPQPLPWQLLCCFCRLNHFSSYFQTLASLSPLSTLLKATSSFSFTKSQSLLQLFIAPGISFNPLLTLNPLPTPFPYRCEHSW